MNPLGVTIAVLSGRDFSSVSPSPRPHNARSETVDRITTHLENLQGNLKLDIQNLKKKEETLTEKEGQKEIIS